MTVRRVTFIRASVAALLALSVPAFAAARQTAAARPQAVAPSATTPQVKATAPDRRTDLVSPQGFSVVLVLGDLQNAAAEDDVPPAARKALADMRDFLPYKSYKLLDAAWILCCAGSRVVNRLRGPDDRDYELEISSSTVENARTSVRFALRETVPDMMYTGRLRGKDFEVRDAEVRAEALETQQHQTEIEGMRAQAGQIETQLREARASAAKAKTGEERQRQNERVRALQAQLSDMNGAINLLEKRARTIKAPRPIIDTSFTMDVGETVVVGTSRLTGGSKALIALLTAVPPRPQRR